MAYVLLALALTSAQLGDLQKSVQEYAMKLTSDENALVKLTFEQVYVFTFYRKDGSKIDTVSSDDEYNTLTEVDLSCDKALVDPVWNGLLVTPFDIGEAKVTCANKAFTDRNLPYNARVVKRSTTDQ